MVAGKALGYDLAHAAMGEFMDGQATPAQIGAFLVGLRMKGETVDEIAGMATAMRERCATIHAQGSDRLVDLCGTGGAALKTFNVSTIAMFVVAAAGVRVAKHGTRAVTSACGSADLLEALGVRVDLDPPDVERVLQEAGMCFMFAPKFHPAMRHVMAPRKEIGLRTVFNILGPLTNPAGARGHVLGDFSPDLVELLPGVALRLGMERALVVHGVAGTDEICMCGPTLVGEVKDGATKRYVLTPRDLGFKRARPEDLAGGTPEEAAKEAVGILRGDRGPKRDMVLANAAAGLYVGGKADTLTSALPPAREALESGRAFDRLVQLVRVTGGDPGRVEA
ncbi:MAG: anthranilate phosphoribosyltransferase [Methanobacteriota archaeon]